MPASLKGKVILVTGATSGIGKATALAAAKAGAHVVLTGRRSAEGEAAAAEARKGGAKAVFVQGDVSKDQDNRRFVAEALKLGGRLDGAFNNAGIEGDLFRSTHEQAEQNYRNVFDINVLGVLLGMKHQVQAMLTTGGGAIVNNASTAGSVGFPGMSVYVASKHAVIGLSRAAALEYAKQGIRVNIVSPAAIKTDMYDRFTGGEGTDFDRQMASMHPVGRAGAAVEIAAAVLFLLSPEASFVTGHNMQVDGGFTAQ